MQNYFNAYDKVNCNAKTKSGKLDNWLLFTWYNQYLKIAIQTMLKTLSATENKF